ncbi:MAG: ATP-binding protein [Clostridiales bacterium]|nr:ATP-binding protein [Clostridiales bacterium]
MEGFNIENAVLDIPRLYTAIAEWSACMVFIALLPKRLHSAKMAVFSTMALIIQIFFLIYTTKVSAAFLWILCMVMAVTFMVGHILSVCRTGWRDAVYCGLQAFVLAEFMASLEWQIHVFYTLDRPTFQGVWKGLLFALPFYGGVCLLYWCLLHRQKMSVEALNIHKNELWPVLLIVVIIFTFSNMSFINEYVSFITPFTSTYSEEIATIRTMVDLSGVAMMFAHYILRCEVRAHQELDTMQQILQSQYQQYEQSRESIELINYKYHDLKHQIEFLRSEKDPEKRNAYLNRMEEEIRQYEAQNKTGNKVLDTILTSKTMSCQQCGISLNCVADGSLLDFIDVIDLCSILGNALDNAIEYEKTITGEEKRLIHVAIFAQKEFLIMRFENYFEGELELNEGLPASSKKEKEFHGYGLKSIRYTVKKYSGAVNVSVQDNWFELKILIPIPENRKGIL